MRRLLLIVLALSIAALGAAPVADAASSKRCKAAVKKAKAKVIKKGKTSLVAKRGSEDNLTLTYFSCLYSKPRLYKLPNQNGGDTEFFGGFRLAGRWVAYWHSNLEAAATENPAWIELVDLRRRKKLYSFDAVPGSSTSQGTQILLQPTGAVAWIGQVSGEPDFESVQTALPDQERPTEVDSGSDIGPRSLRRVPGDPNSFSWERAGVRKTAPLGG